MLWLFSHLASPKLTLLGMILLGLGAVLSYGNPMTVSIWVLVVPLAFLSINITAAIITNPRIFGQPGLLLFHVCLLITVLLAGLGRLIHLDAHVELTEGEAFASDKILAVNKGPWHQGDIDKIEFIQGKFTVEYLAELQRRDTRSEVFLPDPKGRPRTLIVGDESPLIMHNYRFYTTFNKGFSPILTWLPMEGDAITGSIHLPGYPLFDYKQANQWKPPGTREIIKFWLQVDAGLTEDKPWVLDGRTATGKLVVTVEGTRVELDPGDEVQLEHGRLRYQELRTWMGYRIFYDPTIHWMFWSTFIGVLGLMYYYWAKMNQKSWLVENDDASDSSPGRASLAEINQGRA